MWCSGATGPTGATDPPEPQGGLGTANMLLNAIGPQDRALTQDPEFTFWKEDHHRYQHHPFGQENVEFLFGNTPDGTVTTFFDRVHHVDVPVDVGDLLGPLVLQVTVPPLLQNIYGSNYVRWAYGGVLAIVDKVQLTANGVILQEFSNRVMDMEAEMTVKSERIRGYNQMTGRTRSSSATESNTYYLPLPFWFCRTEGSSRPYLPLCSLSKEVALNVRVHIKPLMHCVNANRLFSNLIENQVLLGSVQMRLMADVVTLDPAERVLFTTRKDKRYLIEEYQEQEDALEAGVVSVTTELAHSRSVKRLHWVLQDAADGFPNTLFGNQHLRYDGYSKLFLEANYNSEGAIMYPPPIRTAQILIGNDAREPLAPTESAWQVTDRRVDSTFYTKVQPLLYEGCNSYLKNYIFGYFFALHPFAYAPSGAYNMSSSSNHLHITLVPNLRRTNLYIYSVGYNVLKIADGAPVRLFID